MIHSEMTDHSSSIPVAVAVLEEKVEWRLVEQIWIDVSTITH